MSQREYFVRREKKECLYSFNGNKRQPLEQRSQNWFDWIFDENAWHVARRIDFILKMYRKMMHNKTKATRRKKKRENAKFEFIRFCLMGLQLYASHFIVTKPSLQNVLILRWNCRTKDKCVITNWTRKIRSHRIQSGRKLPK